MRYFHKKKDRIGNSEQHKRSFDQRKDEGKKKIGNKMECRKIHGSGWEECAEKREIII